LLELNDQALASTAEKGQAFTVTVAPLAVFDDNGDYG
jgi:hypothetical protein